MSQLDVVLELVCEELQLTQTQYDDATRSYEVVGEWLDQAESSLAPYTPEVSPQGSMDLGTTNKPRDREEFDVDLICLLAIDPTQVQPGAVYEAVLTRLKESGVYGPMIEPKDRCIRLDYAGQFHLDVIPACPSSRFGVPWGELAMVIPDRSLSIWVPTNPRGYSHWFRARDLPGEQQRIAASVKPLPPNVGLAGKTVLHRVVQLFKRRRDVHFDGGTFAPRSILLTTIDGLFYRGGTSILDTVTHILDQLAEWRWPVNGNKPPIIQNPTDPGENLARHWREDRRHFTSFIEYVVEFRDGMERLRAARGMVEIGPILNDLFDPSGSGVVKRAIAAYVARIQESRDKREVGFLPRTSGLITVAASPRARPIPRNSFYGAED